MSDGLMRCIIVGAISVLSIWGMNFIGVWSLVAGFVVAAFTGWRYGIHLRRRRLR